MGELNFTRPVNYPAGDRYGSRGGTHYGVDYPAPKGTSVQARERGKTHFNREGYNLVALIILSIILFLAPMASAGEKQKVKTAEEKEVFIERGVSNRRPIWCGGKGILVYSITDESAAWEEVFSYDVEAARKVKIVDGSAPLTCAPDGEWLLYHDNRSYRRAKDDPEKAVFDLWRYEFKTKEHQQIAVVYETEVDAIIFGENNFSPNEIRLYLGKKPAESMEMPEPKWKIIWSQNELLNAVWLPVFSGIISARFNREDESETLVLEFFDPERKAIALKPPLSGHARSIQMAGPNRIYLLLNKRGDGFGPYGKDIVVSCEVNRSEALLSCVDVLELNHDIRNYALFSDGETIVFIQVEDRCVRIKRKGKNEAACVTTGNYRLGNYVSVSPDNKWLAFTVSRKRDGENSYADDLYVVKLTSQVRW